MSTRNAAAIADRSLRATGGLSDEALAAYNRGLANAYDSQLTQLLKAIDKGDRTATQIHLRKLSELANAAGNEFEALFQDVLTEAAGNGLTLADELVAAYDPTSKAAAFGEVNFESIAAQARDGADRLKNHTQTAIDKIQDVVTQGLAEGTNPKVLTRAIAGQLNLLKSRAENIARTETLSALNRATTDRYKRHGIEYVQLMALIDNRTTPECRFRHMKIIKITESQPPYHFQCRTVTMSVKPEWLTEDDYAFAAQEYERAAEGALNRASIFEEMNDITPPNVTAIQRLLSKAPAHAEV